MKQEKKFVIQIGSVKNSLKEFADTFKKLQKGEEVKPKEKLTFVDINTLRKFATDKRIELLKVIKEKKPRSIKELERLTNRDYKSINTDLTVLKEAHLISLDKEDNKVVPKVNYEKINIQISLSA